ncbi:hypothetical protein [Kocuria aegyptia]|uniref:Uncharacterized protein n=1 Tax=Kocuria aegyptia TaxID=330943 RepID=A0ABP4WQM6_9MICC
MSAAALSALLGAGLVAASHLVTVLVARATAGAEGPVAAPALAMTYVLKVLLLGWVLLTVPAPPWLAPGWVAAGVLSALVVSLALAARAGARGTRSALGPVLAARRAEAEHPDGPGAAAGTGAREQDARERDGRERDGRTQGDPEQNQQQADRERDDQEQADRRQDDHEHG